MVCGSEGGGYIGHSIQTLPSCLQGEMPSSSSTEQSNDGKLHVALFDDRPEPNVRAMMGFVRCFGHVTIGGSMTFHAILAQQRTQPGIRVTSLRDAVPDRVRCIMSGMARLLTSRRGKRMQASFTSDAALVASTSIASCC